MVYHILPSHESSIEIPEGVKIELLVDPSIEVREDVALVAARELLQQSVRMSLFAADSSMDHAIPPRYTIVKAP